MSISQLTLCIAVVGTLAIISLFLLDKLKAADVKDVAMIVSGGVITILTLIVNRALK